MRDRLREYGLHSSEVDHLLSSLQTIFNSLSNKIKEDIEAIEAKTRSPSSQKNIKIEVETVPETKVIEIGGRVRLTYWVHNEMETPLTLKEIRFGTIKGFTVYQLDTGKQSKEHLYLHKTHILPHEKEAIELILKAEHPRKSRFRPTIVYQINGNEKRYHLGEKRFFLLHTPEIEFSVIGGSQKNRKTWTIENKQIKIKLRCKNPKDNPSPIHPREVRNLPPQNPKHHFNTGKIHPKEVKSFRIPLTLHKKKTSFKPIMIYECETEQKVLPLQEITILKQRTSRKGSLAKKDVFMDFKLQNTTIEPRKTQQISFTVRNERTTPIHIQKITNFPPYLELEKTPGTKVDNMIFPEITVPPQTTIKKWIQVHPTKEGSFSFMPQIQLHDGTILQSKTIEIDVKPMKFHGKRVSPHESNILKTIQEKIQQIPDFTAHHGKVIGLSFRGTKFSDLSLLTELQHLKTLDLHGTPISDITPLQELQTLQVLKLGLTDVKNLSQLTHLQKIEQLNLDYIKAYDFTPLKHLKHLQELSLHKSNISDLTPLKPLHNLRKLDLSHTSLTTLAPLKHLEKLRELNLGYTGITDLSPLKNLTKLQKLELYKTKVSDVSPLKHLPRLRKLDLYKTNVQELSPLHQLKRLRQLDISKTDVADLSPLKELDNLQTLILGHTPIPPDDKILKHLERRGVKVRIP